ncbi:hypothetical protein QQ045_014124 [Rhodiola kirilowii]
MWRRMWSTHSEKFVPLKITVQRGIDTVPVETREDIMDELEPSLIELTLEFFNPLLPRSCLETKFNDEPEHILDVFLQSFLTPMQPKTEQPDQWTFLRRKRSLDPARDEQEKQLIHCASELQKAGIKFKRREKYHQLRDINFSKGVLDTPPLYINDNTVPI